MKTMRPRESMTTALMVVDPASMPSQQRPRASAGSALGTTSAPWRRSNSALSSSEAKRGRMRGDSAPTSAVASALMRSARERGRARPAPASSPVGRACADWPPSGAVFAAMRAAPIAT